jgi:predicted RND superfamily exporter protein
MMATWWAWLARSTVRHAPAWWLAALALSAVAVASMRSFRVEGDVSRVLPSTDPDVQLYRRLEERLTASRTLFLLVHGADTAEVEQRVRRAADALRQSPWLERVDATLAELMADAAATARTAPLWFLSAASLDELASKLTPAARRQALDDLLERMASDPLAARELALADPFGLRWTLAAAQRELSPIALDPRSEFMVLAEVPAALLRVVGKREPFDAEFAAALMADVESRLADVPHDAFGGYAIARAQASSMRADLTSSVTSSLLLLSLYLALAMRSVLAPVAVLLPVAIAVLWALPLGGALFGPFNALAIGAAAVLLGLGVDFGIHTLVQYQALRARADHATAVAGAYGIVGTPLLLCMLTTCAAFLSLATGSFSALAGFGGLLALGIALALLLNFTLLPGALAVVRLPQCEPRSRVTDALLAAGSGRAGLPIAVGLLVAAMAAGTVGFARLEFDASAESLTPRDDATVRMRARIEQMLGFSPVAATILLPEDVEADEAARGLRTLTEAGLVGFCDGPEPYWPPTEQRAAVADFRARSAGWAEGARADLEAAGFAAEAFEPTLARWQELLAAEPPPLPARYWLESGGRRFRCAFCYPRRALDTEDRWREFEAAVARAFDGRARAFSGMALMGRVADLLTADISRAAAVAGVFAVACVLALTRRASLALAVVLPVLAGLALTVGVVAAFGIPLTLGNFVAVPFLIGIGVDNGIHLAKHGSSTGAGLGRVGVAMWRSSVTNALGFGSLITSSTPSLRTFGIISGLGVAACLLCCLLMIPALVRLLQLQRAPRP